MDPKTYFHLVGYTFGLIAFVLAYLALRPSLLAQGRDPHLKVLISVHFFRYFGLTALLPGVFNLSPAGFSPEYLTQIMAGDVLVAALALISFALFLFNSSLRIGFAWIFNIVGTLDYMNAAARVTPAIHDANILGPFGWIILTVMLPLWLVSHDGSNHRSDEYGGSIENRARFLFGVIDAMIEAWSADRVGVKISPSNTSYGIRDSDPLATFTYAIAGLSDRNLAYLHLMEPDQSDLDKGIVQIPNVIDTFGPMFHGKIIANGGFDLARADAILSAGKADFVSFGKLFVANPDLPARFATGTGFNPPDFATFYGEGPKGYIDYPTYQ